MAAGGAGAGLESSWAAQLLASQLPVQPMQEDSD